jgi:aminopeptidase
MPTEEVFTMPFKYGVNGKIAATKPLNYGGNLIEDFVLYFKDGKVVDYTAKAGLETLKGLIETDEGSAYLGEVAIVPQNSPVSNTQVLFYNTLFDENASCHFALGSAYPETLKDGTKMTKEALEKAGANTSITHVDFMVGSKDLTIEAETHSGEKFFVLKDGEWGF